jgi:hypothetical protein
LSSVLKKLEQNVEELYKKQSGKTGFFRKVLKADSTGTKISAYRERIKQLQANFMVCFLICTGHNS